MPGFDDSGTGFDAAVSFDDAGAGGGGSTFAVEGWGGISLSIEVAFTVQDFIIGTSIIGTTHLGPIPTWTDITPYVQEFSTKRGRQRALERFSTGTASFQLDNVDGRFDPTNLSGPYVASGATLVQPGCHVRVRAEYGSTIYPIWYGFADSWDGSWAKHRAGAGAAWAGLTASGVFEWAAGLETATGPAQGARETSGQRMSRVLNALAWSTELRVLDTGVATMQDTNLEGSIVDQLQIAADSEGGVVYEGKSGEIVFLDRQSPFTLARSASAQSTYGDGSGEFRYYDISSSFSKDLVRNEVTLGRDGSDTTVFVDDGVSRRKYGPKSYSNTNLQNENDVSLIFLAEAILAQFTTAELRFDSMVVTPQHDPTTLWPEILERELRDRIEVIRRPAAGNTIAREVYIESISHNVTHDLWTTSFELSSASAFVDNPFIIGTSLLGGTDVLVF